MTANASVPDRANSTPPGSSPLLLLRATDWAGQTWEERLQLCIETLYVHQLIKPSTYQHAMTDLRARAEAQRERRASTRRLLDIVCSEGEIDHG